MSLVIAVLWMVSYLFGAIPFAYLIARWHGVDLYSIGSGNIGATNVSRALGRKWGILVFVLDFLKGVLPVVTIEPLAKLWDSSQGEPFGISDITRVGACTLALLGHIYPVYLGFKGGKGVATGSGVALALMPIPGLASVVAWLISAVFCRYVSLSSIVAGIVLIVVHLGTTPQPLSSEHWLITSFCVIATIFVIVKHRSNIRRLLNGTESKIGQRSTQSLPTSPSS